MRAVQPGRCEASLLSPDASIKSEGRRWDELLATGLREGTGDAARLEDWRRAVDPDDTGLFARRLAWDGLDEAGSALLAAAGAPATARDPVWWDELEDLRAACRRAAGPADAADAEWASGIEQSAGDADRRARLARIPFVHLLRPLADRTLERLERVASREALAALSPEARDDARHALLSRLEDVTARVLYEEYTAARPFGRSAMLALGPPTGAAAPRDRYVAFCRGHLQDGLGSLLATYPVLGRLLVTVCRQWRETLNEFLERLHDDRDLLARSLGVDPRSSLGELRWSAGDRHHGGRSVAVVRFAGGPTIVYKPRDVGGEARFADLTTMLAARLDAGWVAAPRVVPAGEDHGYVSFVPNAPCASRAELVRFYRNAGRLLAVLHLLGATDFHSENLIASGSSLVVVDAETLFEDRVVAEGSAAQGERLRAEPLALSVLQTLMLPAWLPDGDGGALRDVSALGADPAPGARIDTPGWQDPNTDVMVWSSRKALLSHPPSLPVGRGAANPVGEHVDELVQGFREVCGLALRPDVRRDLETAIRRFAGARRRILLRHTRTYAIVQHRALAPRALRSAAARGCELERLSRAFLLHHERPPLWPLFHAELRDLDDLDVPCFEHRLGSTRLSGTGVSLSGAVAGDALDRALARVAALSPEEVDWQTRLIRAALQARGSRAAADHASGPPGTAAPVRPAVRAGDEPGGSDTAGEQRPVLDPETSEREVRRLAGEMAAAALTDGRGDVTWLTPAVLPSLLPESRRVALWLISDGLYDGRAGVFAFLHAWSASGGTEEDARLAAAALAPVLAALDGADHERFRYLRDLGLGLNGVGGLLRVFGHLAAGSAEGRCEWTRRRDQLAAAVDERLVAATTELDLLGGAAGAVAPLAALHAERPGGGGARALTALASRLLDAQDARTGAWFTENPVRPLTGLSHGASGIGLALLEAGVALRDARMVDAAARAFAYEAAVFDDAAGNWPDFRGDPDEPRCVTGWCHGAPGIALARMRALQLAPGHPDAGLWARDLEAGAAATAAAPLGGADHLCCGNLGRATVLLALGAVRGVPAWTAAGAALTAAVVRRAAEEGGYRLPQLRVGAGDGLVFPGLMSGSAGIGLHLLAATGRADLVHLLV